VSPGINRTRNTWSDVAPDSHGHNKLSETSTPTREHKLAQPNGLTANMVDSPPMQYDVFIAHPSERKADARACADALRARGVVAFVDDQMEPGAIWMETLRRVQEACRATVFLWYADLKPSPYLRDEVETALERNKTFQHLIFPVWIGRSGGRLPYGLSNFQATIFAESWSDFATSVARQLDDPTFAREREIERLERLRAELRQLGSAPDEASKRIRDLRRERRVQGVPARLGKWELLEPLGSGGFATVYLARPAGTLHRGMAAIKVLHADRMEHGESVDRFCSGSLKMYELQDHSGIVMVHDWATRDMTKNYGHIFFVMEYVDGGDLRRAVSAGLALEAGIEIVIQAADAAAHAHSKGRIHRDIKPANILIGRNGRAKLTDFDLVLAEESTHGTRTGSALGTVLYAAPEQMESAGRVDKRADVYSLGMVLAFIITGGALNARHAMYRREQFLAQLPCSEALRAVVRVATAPEEADRFANMESFIQAVTEAMAPQSVSLPIDADLPFSPTPSVPTVSPQPPPRRRSVALEDEPTNPRLTLPHTTTTTQFDTTYWTERVRIPQNRAPSPSPPQVAPTPLKPPRTTTTSTSPQRSSQVSWSARQVLQSLPSLSLVNLTGGTSLRGRRARPPRPSADAAATWTTELPQHPVTIAPFAIAITPVTQAQWRTIHAGLEKNPSRFRGRPDSDNRPVENVSWFDAVRWCNALSLLEGRRPAYRCDEALMRVADLTSWDQWSTDPDLRRRLAEAASPLPGDGYRLPTEAEWEFACRAGSETSFWSGEDAADLARVGWFDQNSERETHVVGKRANPWGLCDMHGNVWEWCTDWFGAYPTETAPDPLGPRHGEWRVVRGGSYHDSAAWCRSACRDAGPPVSRLPFIGFRIAVSLPHPPSR
jgi:formylglycine-generating enzyme required for sulfatase activity